MSLDEFQVLFTRLERRMRETVVVEALANPDFALDTKTDFANEEELRKVAAVLEGPA